MQFDELISDRGSTGRSLGIRFHDNTQPGKLATGLIGPGNDFDGVVSRSGNVGLNFYRTRTAEKEVIAVRADATSP